MHQNNSLLCHLNLIEGIGPASAHAIMERVVCQPELSLYTMSAQDMHHTFKLPYAKAKMVVEGLQSTALLEQEFELIHKHKVTLISIFDAEYPSLLKTIHMPPSLLYVKGPGLAACERSIAVIGARKANSYGQQAIQLMVPELIAHGFSIISGGARGADSMAHKAALSAQGITVAILGSGLAQLYPPENVPLFEKMIHEGGAIVSPFPMMAPPLPPHFPARNRLIAGMSMGCLVVQAAEQSGARITAQMALEQGREVFAVPGSIFDPLSLGCHALLEQGAILVKGAQDIIQSFGMESFIQSCIEDVNEEPALDLSPAAKITLMCRQPSTFDDLQASSGLAFTDLNDLLFSLQLEGKVSQTPQGLWQSL